MRTGYKVGAAGLAVVLGCTVVAFSPLKTTQAGSATSNSATASGLVLAQGTASASQSSGLVDEVSGSSDSLEQASPDSASSIGLASTSGIECTARNASSGENIYAAADSDAADETPSVAYRDGIYRSTGTGRVGSVPVTVAIENGRITCIKLGANSEEPAMAERAQAAVVPQIIQNQSTDDIQTVTGATLTSEAIIDAVSKALANAAITD